MRVVVTGATGFVGRALVQRLREEGHEVVAISRNPTSACERLSIEEAHDWDHLDDAFAVPLDAVVHLAGESVQGLWTQAKIKEVWDSRIFTTTAIVNAIKRAPQRPQVLVSASGIGFYGEGGDEVLRETSPPGDDYFAELCVEWENLVHGIELADVRTVTTRFGIVLGNGGGALGVMALPAKTGLSGPLGSGKQWWSWVSIRDAVSALMFTLSTDVQGPINVVAPEAIQQIDFQKTLCAALGRPCFVPAPAFAVRMVLGRFATEVLSSKRVDPHTLRTMGYEWADPDLQALLTELL